MTSVDEFSDIELNASKQVGSFRAKTGFDVKKKLDELAENASKMKDYSLDSETN